MKENVFSLMCTIAKKFRRYEAGRDDRGLDISKLHMAWVQAMYVPCNN
jgi:hypothetical protein